MPPSSSVSASAGSSSRTSCRTSGEAGDVAAMASTSATRLDSATTAVSTTGVLPKVNQNRSSPGRRSAGRTTAPKPDSIPGSTGTRCPISRPSRPLTSTSTVVRAPPTSRATGTRRAVSPEASVASVRVTLRSSTREAASPSDSRRTPSTRTDRLSAATSGNVVTRTRTPAAAAASWADTASQRPSSGLQSSRCPSVTTHTSARPAPLPERYLPAVSKAASASLRAETASPNPSSSRASTPAGRRSSSGRVASMATSSRGAAIESASAAPRRPKASLDSARPRTSSPMLLERSTTSTTVSSRSPATRAAHPPAIGRPMVSTSARTARVRAARSRNSRRRCLPRELRSPSRRNIIAPHSTTRCRRRWSR